MNQNYISPYIEEVEPIASIQNVNTISIKDQMKTSFKPIAVNDYNLEEDLPSSIETKIENKWELIVQNDDSLLLKKELNEQNTFINTEMHQNLPAQFSIPPPKLKYPVPPKVIAKKDPVEEETETDISSAAVSNVFGVIKHKQAKPKKGVNRLKNMYANPF